MGMYLGYSICKDQRTTLGNQFQFIKLCGSYPCLPSFLTSPGFMILKTFKKRSNFFEDYSKGLEFGAWYPSRYCSALEAWDISLFFRVPCVGAGWNHEVGSLTRASVTSFWVLNWWQTGILSGKLLLSLEKPPVTSRSPNPSVIQTWRRTASWISWELSSKVILSVRKHSLGLKEARGEVDTADLEGEQLSHRGLQGSTKKRTKVC